MMQERQKVVPWAVVGQGKMKIVIAVVKAVIVSARST